MILIQWRAFVWNLSKINESNLETRGRKCWNPRQCRPLHLSKRLTQPISEYEQKILKKKNTKIKPSPPPTSASLPAASNSQ